MQRGFDAASALDSSAMVGDARQERCSNALATCASLENARARACTWLCSSVA
jgi:hypothetical protein